MMYLKQSTGVTLKIGPFLDETDGKTAETGLTISQADVRLSKNGGNIAQKNEATSCTHDELGVYGCPIDSTDTATLGRLQVWVHESGALPVWHEFMVVPANVWDSLFGADRLQVDVREKGDSALALTTQEKADVNAEADTAIADYDSPTKAELDSGLAALNDLSAAEVNAEADTALSDYDAPTKAELDSGLAALNDLSAAEVNAEVDTALEAVDLDHLVKTTYGATKPADGSLLDQVMNKNVSQTFDPTTDSLEAIRDRGDAAWAGTGATKEEIADQVWDEAISGHAGAGTFGAKNQKVVPSETIGDYKADVSNLDVAVSTRAPEAGGNIAAILADTATIAWSDITTIDTLIDGIVADIGTFPSANYATLAAYVEDIRTRLTAIVADTNELQGDWVNGGRLDLLVDAIKAKTDTIVWGDVTTIDGIVDDILVDTAAIVWGDISTIDGIVDAILVDTDALEKIGTNRWKIISNQLIIYDDDESTPLYTFDLKDSAGDPAMENVYERVIA